MGADIYLHSENDKKRAEFKVGELQDKWLTSQKNLAPKSVVEEARLAYVAASNKADEGTYFRDSYNSSNLAWILGLSYWNEGNNCDEDTGRLPVERVKHWLEIVSKANIRECVTTAIANHVANRELPSGTPFEQRKKPELVTGDEEKLDDVVAYFERKQKDFTALLSKAVELNEPLGWSV